MDTTHRPRLSEETNDRLKNIVDEIKHHRDENDADISKYKGRSSDVKEDKVINEALKTLQEQGVV